MGNVKKTPLLALLCIILSVLTLIAMMPGTAYAQDDAEGNAPQAGQNETAGSPASRTWDYSKSKTATELAVDSSGNLTSEITLSLPSKEEKLDSDIVFVMDKSSCSAATAAKMEELLGKLDASLQHTQSRVNLALVAFDGKAHEIYPLTEFASDQIDAIKEKVTSGIPKTDKVSGTNMHAGLLAAKQLLDQDTSVSANRKYVITVTDGLTRLFNGSDGKVKDIYYRGQYSYGGFYGMIGEWSNFRFGNEAFNPPAGWTWQAYWKDVQNWVAKDGDKYVHDFETYGNDASGKVTDPASFAHLTDTGEDSASSHAMVVDRAVYEAYKAYESMVNSGYRCYAVEIGNSGFGKAFLDALNNLAGNSSTVDFDKITNAILYLVGAGSTVTDQIGCKEGDYNFDLVDPAKMTLSIDDAEGSIKTYDAEKIDENHYGFLPQSDGTYAYEAVYTPGDKKTGEQIKWTINVPVTNFQHVSLNYQVKLTNPKTKAGTYGQKDFNGDGIVDGTKTAVDPSRAIYTNTSAVLVPVDSAGKTGASEAFDKPSVSYTVDKSNPTDPDADKKDSGILLPKVIAKGKHTQVFTWTALKHVDGYFIYTNRCNVGKHVHTPKKVADYKASKARVYTRKHLKTHRCYKYYVAAYKIKNGRKVIVKKSLTVHSVCGNSNARFTNTKAVKVKKHAVTLKKGQTYKIKANVYKVKKNRALLNHRHASRLRYLSRNSRIAKVSYSTGKVKALKAGKTTIYVLGVNGVRDKVTVTVE